MGLGTAGRDFGEIDLSNAQINLFWKVACQTMYPKKFLPRNIPFHLLLSQIVSALWGCWEWYVVWNTEFLLSSCIGLCSCVLQVITKFKKFCGIGLKRFHANTRKTCRLFALSKADLRFELETIGKEKILSVAVYVSGQVCRNKNKHGHFSSCCFGLILALVLWHPNTPEPMV